MWCRKQFIHKTVIPFKGIRATPTGGRRSSFDFFLIGLELFHFRKSLYFTVYFSNLVVCLQAPPYKQMYGNYVNFTQSKWRTVYGSRYFFAASKIYRIKCTENWRFKGSIVKLTHIWRLKLTIDGLHHDVNATCVMRFWWMANDGPVGVALRINLMEKIILITEV